MFYCENCGTTLEDGTVFCSECGTRVNTSQVGTTSRGSLSNVPQYQYQQPNQVPASNNNNSAMIVASLVVGAAIIGGAFWYTSSSDSIGCGETSNTAKSKQQSEQLTAEEKNWTKAGVIEGVRLGATLEKVKRVIGESPKNKKDINGLERYYFQNVTIDIQNGKVVFITTETPQPYYNNKWHEGSSWRDIKSELGNNYDEFSAEGMTMYEYSVASEDKKSKAIVRFAVKNDGKIDYISIKKDANV